MLLLDWLSPPALAHGFAAVPMDDVPISIWWEWKLEWVPLAAILALFFVYFRAAHQARVRSSETVLTRGQAVRFVLGWSVIYTGIASPIDAIGEQYLFAARSPVLSQPARAVHGQYGFSGPCSSQNADRTATVAAG